MSAWKLAAPGPGVPPPGGVSFSPSGAHTPDGTCRAKCVRYQPTPGGTERVAHASGSATGVHDPSGSDGSAQPASEPANPAGLVGPRTGSRATWAAEAPSSRQVTAGAVPLDTFNVALSSPRGVLSESSCNEFANDSSWPMFSVRTETTLSCPDRTVPAGKLNLWLTVESSMLANGWVAVCVVAEPGWCPLRQT